jgi:hypothetical protein
MGFLFRESAIRHTPRLVSDPSASEVSRKKRWSVFKWIFSIIFVLATIPSFGGSYFKYLWPAYPDWVSHAARPIFDTLGIVGAFIASTRRRRNQRAQPGTGYGTEKGPWLDDRAQTFISVALIGIAVVFGIYHFTRSLPPVSQLRITMISAGILALILVVLSKRPFRPEASSSLSEIQQKSLVENPASHRRTKSRRMLRFWLWASVFAIVWLMNLVPAFRTAPKELKSVTIFAPLAILIVWAVVLTQLKRWANGLARQGEFDRALRVDRRLARIPGYGTPLEGSILFNAGRYSEARLFVKDSAFDEQGQPKLTSHELYIYAISLINDGKEAEAQKLLEAAVLVPQRSASLHVSLATCLLSQKKDPSRACVLLEQAMAFSEPQASGYGRTSDHTKRLGRYAWALAAAGRRAEAEAKIQEAFAGSASLKERDLAGLHYFVGEAWRSMGEWKKARAAFDEALRLSPDGSAATSAKRALAKLREEERG